MGPHLRHANSEAADGLQSWLYHQGAGLGDLGQFYFLSVQ